MKSVDIRDHEFSKGFVDEPLRGHHREILKSFRYDDDSKMTATGHSPWVAGVPLTVILNFDMGRIELIHEGALDRMASK